MPSTERNIAYIDVSLTPIGGLDTAVQRVTTFLEKYPRFEPFRSPTGVWLVAPDEGAGDSLLRHAARVLIEARSRWKEPPIVVRLGFDRGPVVASAPTIGGVAAAQARAIAEFVQPYASVLTSEFATSLSPWTDDAAHRRRRPPMTFDDEGERVSYEISPTLHSVPFAGVHLIETRTITGSVSTRDGTETFGQGDPLIDEWMVSVRPPLLSLNPTTGRLIKLPPLSLLEKHTRAAFIGRNNKSLPATLRTRLELKTNRRLECVEIYYLSDPALERARRRTNARSNVYLEHEREPEPHQQLVVEKRESIEQLRKLTSDFPTFDLKLYEYQDPFYFASYWDWDRPGGRIHVSPYVFNQRPSYCPATDYTWVDHRQPTIFQILTDGLDWLRENATPLGRK